MNREKTYKAKPPKETVNFARKLLRKSGIKLKEEYKNTDGFYSCRIFIDGLLCEMNLGTNGKGMTKEYALASAYGEFMERIQNSILLPHISHRLLNLYSVKNYENVYPNFMFAPDEQMVLFNASSPEILNHYIRCSNIDSLINYYNGNYLCLVPYYNVNNGVVEMLPINVIHSLCTSNGMCAGNTPEEAIAQGLCEIVERFVMNKIYNDNISFPNIDLQFFKGSDIYEKINFLKSKYKVSIVVKDCSCGLNLPVIGALIIDENNYKYAFHIGAAFSPIVALERIFTELFQGRNKIPLKDINWDIQCNLLGSVKLKNEEKRKTTVRNEGQFPISLLYGTPNYEYKGFDDSWYVSDKMDLKKIVNTLKTLGYSIYVRDVSFLGFNSYSIYVPGMSEVADISTDEMISINEQYIRAMKVSENVQKCSLSSLRILIAYIEKWKQRALDELSCYSVNTFWKRYDIDILLAFLCYTSENYAKSLMYIQSFLHKGELTSKETLFYKCIESLICVNLYKTDIKYVIEEFGEKLTELCLNFMTNRNYLTTMGCDNKSESLSVSAKLSNLLSMEKCLENIYITNLPNQYELSQIFDF